MFAKISTPQASLGGCSCFTVSRQRSPNHCMDFLAALLSPSDDLSAGGVDPFLTSLCCTTFLDLIVSVYSGPQAPRAGLQLLQ